MLLTTQSKMPYYPSITFDLRFVGNLSSHSHTFSAWEAPLPLIFSAVAAAAAAVLVVPTVLVFNA